MKTYIKSNRLISVFNLFVILTCLFPMGEIFSMEEAGSDTPTRNEVYVYDGEMIFIFIPLILCAVLFQFMRFNIWRRLILLATIFFSGIYSFIGLSGMLPAQDFLPGISLVLMMFIAPLSIAIWFVDARDFRSLRDANE